MEYLPAWLQLRESRNFNRFGVGFLFCFPHNFRLVSLVFPAIGENDVPLLVYANHLNLSQKSQHKLFNTQSDNKASTLLYYILKKRKQ